MIYWKYNLDIDEPIKALVKFHTLEDMIQFVNTLKHGARYGLISMTPYRVKPPLRYKGQYYVTKKGVIRIRF